MRIPDIRPRFGRRKNAMNIKVKYTRRVRKGNREWTPGHCDTVRLKHFADKDPLWKS